MTWVYTWEGKNPIGPITEIFPPKGKEDNFKVKPGLSSFAPTGEGAGKSLEPLITAAKSLIPSNHWGITPLSVLGTAGMREVEPRSAQMAVLANTEEYLSDSDNSPFDLLKVNIISGAQEASAAFISINSGISDDQNDWYGLLELGGASTQYAVYYDGVLANSQFLLWEDEVIDFYGQSLPGYGMNDARNRYQESLVEDTNPNSDDGTYNAVCFSANYLEPYTSRNGTVVMINGTGDPVACTSVINNLLHLDYYCPLAPCGPLGRYVPELFSEKEYVNIEIFLYSTRFGFSRRR